VICNPSGQIVAGPLRHAEGILTAEVDLSQSVELRRMFDATGHYNRPDVFQLKWIRDHGQQSSPQTESSQASVGRGPVADSYPDRLAPG
jgi:hypothetical protein